MHVFHFYLWNEKFFIKIYLNAHILKLCYVVFVMLISMSNKYTFTCIMQAESVSEIVSICCKLSGVDLGNSVDFIGKAKKTETTTVLI